LYFSFVLRQSFRLYKMLVTEYHHCEILSYIFLRGGGTIVDVGKSAIFLQYCPGHKEDFQFVDVAFHQLELYITCVGTEG
jgi:hypothetical protein